jgi:hypothetical protein
VPVLVAGDLTSGVGVFAPTGPKQYDGKVSGAFGTPAEQFAPFATARASVTEELKEFKVDVSETRLSFAELPRATFSAADAMRHVENATRQSGERMSLAAGHAAASIIGSAKKIDQVMGAFGQIAGMLPGGGQVGRKRGFFSKMLGFAAPFLSFIPGVGPLLSTLAGIGSSALGGDYGAALSQGAAGFATGGAFRRSGSQSGGSTQTVNVGAGLEPRALGGPVRKGRTYIVGEHRAEVFEPEVDGFIHPSMDAFHGSRGGAHGRGLMGGALAGVLNRIEAHFARLDAVSFDHVYTTGARRNPGATADSFMRGAARDPRVTEWMNRRVQPT